MIATKTQKPKRRTKRLVKLSRTTHPNTPWRVRWREDGKDRQKWLATREAAEAFALVQEAALVNHGTAAATVTDEERAALRQFRVWRDGQGDRAPSLAAVLLAGQAALQSTSDSTATVDDLIALRLAEVKRDAGDRHQKDTEARLARFAKDYGPTPAAALTPDTIGAWVHGLNLAPQTRRHYLATISALLECGVKNGKLEINAAKRTARPKVIWKPRILTVAEMRRLLDVADRAIMPLVILQSMCGCRRAEIQRMHWADIRLDEKKPFINLDAAITKNGSRRTVPLQGCAAAWLRSLRQPAGVSLALSSWDIQRYLEKAAEDAGIKWQPDILRHTFCSFRLAATADVARTAVEAGNSPAILDEHYKELVSPEDAIEFWRILPPGSEKGIVPFKRRKA